MKLDKFALIVLLTLLIGGAAFYFSQQETEQRQDQEAGDIYLKSLSKRINDVASIAIESKSLNTNLTLSGNDWVVKEKNNYPADFSKVKQLILELSGLKTIESKTNRPENYSKLGVQDVKSEGDIASTRIDLYDKAGNKLESLIIGKARESRVPGSSPALYVRKASEHQSWLVSGSVKLPATVEDWLNKKIVDIKSADIQSVAIIHPKGDTLSVEKANKEDKHFKVNNMPENAKLKSESIADGLANGLSNLTFDDVALRKSFEMGSAKPTKIDYKTFDGLQISAKLIEKDQKHFLLLDTQATVEDNKVKQEAVKIGSQFAQWVYQLAEFKAKNMIKTLDDMLEKPKETTDKQQDKVEN